jgi:hypothetical protein
MGGENRVAMNIPDLEFLVLVRRTPLPEENGSPSG